MPLPLPARRVLHAHLDTRPPVESPPAQDEIERLPAVAPGYGIELLVPGH